MSDHYPYLTAHVWGRAAVETMQAEFTMRNSGFVSLEVIVNQTFVPTTGA
jgi:hypothetical protein